MGKTLRTLFKLGLTGATIFMIWLVFLVVGSAGPVQDASADIFTFSFSPKSQKDRFEESLKKHNFGKVRGYDWNGNQLYFSSMVTRDDPVQVLERMQRTFVETGVNQHAHRQAFPGLDGIMSNSQQVAEEAGDAHMRWSDDFFGGGVVPIGVLSDHVVMAGAESRGKASNAFDFIREQMSADGSMMDTVRGMRFVEAFRENGQTRVHAIWSDDELDLRKLHADQSGYDPEVPACIGCNRLMRLGGQGAERDYVTTIFEGQRSPTEMIRFYDQSLLARGWVRSDRDKLLDRAEEIGLMPRFEARTSTWSRGTEFLSVMAFPDENGTTQVKVVQSP